MKLGATESPVGNEFLGINAYPGELTRMLDEYEQNRSASAANELKLDPAELQKQYPGVFFDKPEYPEVAALRAAHQSQRDGLQMLIQGGSPTFGGGLAAGTVNFVSDPFNQALMGLTIATGGGAAIAEGLGGSTAAKIAGSYAENIGIMGAGGIAHYVQENREGNRVTIPEEVFNVAGGAAIGTGVHFVGQAIWDAMAPQLARMSDQLKAKLLGQTIAQLEAGQRPDVSPQLGAVAAREAGQVAPGKGVDPYVFLPQSSAQGRTFYESAAPGKAGPASLSDFGPGVSGVDRPMVANNLASHPESPDSGTIREFRVAENAKLLDLDSPAKGSPFLQALEAKTGVKLDLPVGSTIRDAIEGAGARSSPDARASLLKGIQGIAKTQGFDGYQYTDSPNGQPHHGVLMFDSSKAELGAEGPANKELTPDVPQYQVPKVGQEAPNNSQYASVATDKDVAQFNTKPLITKPADLDPILQAQEADAQKLLARQAKESDAVAAQVEGLTRQKSQNAREIQAVRDLTDCFTGEL
jgi:hypothetical protein